MGNAITAHHLLRNMLRSLLSLVSLSALVVSSQAQAAKWGCVVEHCVPALAKCMANTECRGVNSCYTKCGTNQTCSYLCSLADPNQQWDDLTGCLTDNKCLVPFPSKKCFTPNATSKFDLNDMKGTWWVVKGMSPAHDCFECAKQQFLLQDDGKWSYQCDFPVTNTNLTGHVYTNLSQVHSGYYAIDYREFGMLQHEDWYVVDVSPDKEYVLVKLCGFSEPLDYAGGLVMSRKLGAIPADIDAQFAKVADTWPNELSRYATWCPLYDKTCHVQPPPGNELVDMPLSKNGLL